MYSVELWVKPTASKSKLYNNKPCIVLAFYDSAGDSGTGSRSLTHKGYQKIDVRSSDEEEFNECGGKYRISFIRYYSWDALIEDEKKFNQGSKKEWLEKLEKHKEKYSMIKS